MTSFDDVTKMTSYLIFLQFYYAIINLYDHKLAKITQLRTTKTQKFKTIQYFHKNSSFTSLNAAKLDNWEGMIVLQLALMF